jgi:L-lactate permease
MSLLLIAITFFILLFFTLVLKKALLISAATGLLTVVLIIVITGGIKLNIILGAGIHGLLVAAEISLLIFGALLFYNYLQTGGFIQNLENSLLQFSANKLVIVILLAFFFGSFIEGVSGFGTPAMIIAPLLLGLRFPAYLAAALPLLANTVPVIFGATGTPIKIGLADLPMQQTPVYAAILMLIPAILIPIIFKLFLERDGLLSKDSNTLKTYFIALMAGVSFVLPFIFFSYFGPVFPSIAASLAGLVIWLLIVKATGSSFATINRTSLLHFYKTFKPYLFITLLLVAGKIIFGNIQFNISWPDIELKKSIQLFQPGLIFIMGLLLLFAFGKNKSSLSLTSVFKQTTTRLPTTFVTIACLSILAKLISQNLDVKELFDSGNIPEPMFYVMAVATGFLGSFIAGSATVSNLMFGTEWHAVGLQFHLNISLLMAAQLAGSAMGNALSIQNIAMVQAMINKTDLESAVISKLWKPILLFLILIMIAVILLGLWLDN